MIRPFVLPASAFLFLAMATAYAPAAEPAKAPAEPEGMKSIFNGKDLSGWDGDPRLWSVKDGAIRGETTAENAAAGNTFIIWQDGKTTDFDLRLSFRCNAANNSGIQYRSKHITDNKVRNKWVVRGYQHEIRNEVGFPNISGFIYDEGGRRGRMAMVGETTVWNEKGEKQATKNLLSPEEFKENFNLDDWNDVIIIARGSHIQHYMNGKLIMDCTDKDAERALSSGVLALQLHAGRPMWCEYKNIRIKQYE